MPRVSPSPPRLLVSVRNVEEARAALEGGCDIVDVKEPTHGSLGRAEPAEIAAIVGEWTRRGMPTPLSAALGEAAERLTLESATALPAGLAFVKMGCAGLGSGPSALAAWRRARSLWNITADCSAPQWIAVVYADWQTARAPSPTEMIELARREECRGVLFDTFDKSGPSLLGCLDPAELQDYAAQIRAQGQWVALAGRIAAGDLERIPVEAADIIAIRGAACARNDRRGRIDSRAVAQFQAALRRRCTMATCGMGKDGARSGSARKRSAEARRG